MGGVPRFFRFDDSDKKPAWRITDENGGEGGIRTHGAFLLTRSPGVPVRPLQHLSRRGEGGIRTHEAFSLPLFESGSMNHSDTSPSFKL